MSAFPSSLPHPSSSKMMLKSSVEIAEFGNPYKQRAPQGTNTKWFEFDLTWNLLSQAEYETMRDFVKPKFMHEPFDWTDHSSDTYQVICEVFDPSPLGGTNWSVTAKFVEDFSI